MSDPVLTALIGAAVAVVGWFAGQFLIRAREHKALLTEAELAFRKRQLEEFYGPIYASLKLVARIYPLWLDGRFREVNTDIIALFKKQNEEVVTILKTKAHLIDGSEFPPAFTRYMTSVSIWGMYCTRPAEPWFPPHVASLDELKWPKEFEEDIFTKTEELKRRLDTLLQKYKAR
jgi:hypothetical protein